MQLRKHLYVWLAAMMSCLSVAVHADTQTLTDVLGREVTLDLPAKRVVLGFYAEDYMAIGTEAAFDHVVGFSRDTWESWRPSNWALFTAYRPSLRAIPDVGEVEAQTFSIEKVIALKPDVVVLADWQYKGLGLDADRLEEAGIPMVVLDYNAQTLERHLASTHLIGQLTGQEARANEIADLYETSINDLQARIAKAKLPKPRVYIEFGNQGPEVFSFTYGKNMWGAMATLAGGDNIAAPFVEWWGPMNPEQILASKPELVVISGTESGKSSNALLMGQNIEPQQSVERLKGFIARPGWSQLPAVKDHRVVGVYQGASRTILDFAMVQFLAKSLYPELFKDIDPQQNYLDFYAKYLPVQPKGTFAVSIDG